MLSIYVIMLTQCSALDRWIEGALFQMGNKKCIARRIGVIMLIQGPQLRRRYLLPKSLTIRRLLHFEDLAPSPSHSSPYIFCHGI